MLRRDVAAGTDEANLALASEFLGGFVEAGAPAMREIAVDDVRLKPREVPLTFGEYACGITFSRGGEDQGLPAAAMYRWIVADQRFAGKFLADLGDRPKEAYLALAKTVALTLDPPAPDPTAAGAMYV